MRVTTAAIPVVTTAEAVAASTTLLPPTATAAKPATNSPAKIEAVKKAVRAYSSAYLGGHAKEAWLMRTLAAQSGDSYAEFAFTVALAKEISSDDKMTSLDVTVADDTATATCTYDISEIKQTDQVWVKEGGAWLVDN
jgi:hypothetical protein